VQERLEATERLRHSLALVDALFDAVPVPLAVKDAQGRCTRTNRAYAETIGLPAPDAVTDAASAQLHHEIDRQLLASGGRVEYEVTQQLASGRTMDAWISKAALQDPRGTPSGVVEVLLDVTTQRQAARLTEEAKRAAEAANHAKSAFLAAMSHEIRTPMNGVLGMAELLLHGELAPPQRDTAQVLHRSARRLLRILDSILDFSKLEAERLELDEEPVDPAQLVRDGVAAQRGHARQRGVAVALELEEGLPQRLRADSLRVSQVLGNLLSNAIKFSAPASGGGGEVRVTARVDGSHWVFEVADNGIGMSEETQARLFDPFTQAEASTTRRFGGTGLGLAISKGLVALMGGGISARSSPGAGSVFTVRLPLVVISDGEDPMLEITAPGVSTEATDTTLAELPALPSPQSAWSGRRPRVLVAEDDPTNRVVVERQLALLHCDAVLTDNGLDALRAWREGRFDALITDVQMPGLDGIELAREVRADEGRLGRPRMPVLALSANVLDSETARARSAGIDDYLTKPIALEALRRVLQTWLDPQGRHHRLSASPARTPDDALTA
jgi:PAS domain S-box-containing protein